MTTDKIVPFYKLTKKEKKHLKESGITTLKVFKSNREFQKEALVKNIQDRKEYMPGLMEPCWECKMIARRLGLETQESQRKLVDDALNGIKYLYNHIDLYGSHAEQVTSSTMLTTKEAEEWNSTPGAFSRYELAEVK